MVRAARNADAYAEVEFPVLSKIEIDTGQEHLLLIAQRIEAAQRTERAVIFKAGVHPLGDVVAQLEVGRELVSARLLRAVKRLVDGRIERCVPVAELLVDNGPDFPGPGIG